MFLSSCTRNVWEPNIVQRNTGLTYECVTKIEGDEITHAEAPLISKDGLLFFIYSIDPIDEEIEKGIAAMENGVVIYTIPKEEEQQILDFAFNDGILYILYMVPDGLKESFFVYEYKDGEFLTAMGLTSMYGFDSEFEALFIINGNPTIIYRDTGSDWGSYFEIDSPSVSLTFPLEIDGETTNILDVFMIEDELYFVLRSYGEESKTYITKYDFENREHNVKYVESLKTFKAKAYKDYVLLEYLVDTDNENEFIGIALIRTSDFKEIFKEANEEFDRNLEFDYLSSTEAYILYPLRETADSYFRIHAETGKTNFVKINDQNISGNLLHIYEVENYVYLQLTNEDSEYPGYYDQVCIGKK